MDDYGIISNCVLTGNQASDWGGGAFCYEHSLATHCRIIGNRANKGGGIALYSSAGMRNCLVAGNAAETKGGGIYLDLDNEVDSCTICGNSAPHGADGDREVSAGVFRNTIIYDPQSDSNLYGGVSAENCCSRSTQIATDPGCITNNPCFIDPAAGNYRLGWGSPCINTGTNQAWMTNAVDLDGEARIKYDIVDMGVYEYDAYTYDTDGDSLTDNDEFFADTSPTNPASLFQITGTAHTNSHTVTFSCTNSREYSLMYSESLVTGDWSLVTGQTNVPGVGSSMSLTDPADATQRSYTVGVSLPP